MWFRPRVCVVVCVLLVLLCLDDVSAGRRGRGRGRGGRRGRRPQPRPSDNYLACSLAGADVEDVTSPCPGRKVCSLGPLSVGIQGKQHNVTFCQPYVMTFFSELQDVMLKKIVEDLKTRACKVDEVTPPPVPAPIQAADGDQAVIKPPPGGEGGDGAVINPPPGGEGGDGAVINPPPGGEGGDGAVTNPPPGGEGGDGAVTNPPPGGEGGDGAVTKPPGDGNEGDGAGIDEPDEGIEDTDDEEDPDDGLETPVCQQNDTCSAGPVTVEYDGEKHELVFCWDIDTPVDWLMVLSGRRRPCRPNRWGSSSSSYSSSSSSSSASSESEEQPTYYWRRYFRRRFKRDIEG